MISQIHGSVSAFSAEPTANTSVPAAGDNVFEELLQKATQENRQNVDASSGGISSANQNRATLEALLANNDTSAASPAAAASTPAESDATTQTPYVPMFQTGVTVVNSLNGQSTDLNSMYYATSETAQYIADKFGTGQVKAEASYSEGNPYQSSGTLYYIQTPNGQWLNAGLLAWNYERMPEAQWPGMADQEIQNQIAQAGG